MVRSSWIQTKSLYNKTWCSLSRVIMKVWTTTSLSWWTRRSRSLTFFRVTIPKVSCRELSLISQFKNSATYTCYMQSQLSCLIWRTYWPPLIVRFKSLRVSSWCKLTSSPISRSQTMSSHLCCSPMWSQGELVENQNPFRSSILNVKIQSLDWLKPCLLLVSPMRILVAQF